MFAHCWVIEVKRGWLNAAVLDQNFPKVLEKLNISTWEIPRPLAASCATQKWRQEGVSGYARLCKSHSQLMFCFADGTRWQDGYAKLCTQHRWWLEPPRPPPPPCSVTCTCMSVCAWCNCMVLHYYILYFAIIAWIYFRICSSHHVHVTWPFCVRWALTNLTIPSFVSLFTCTLYTLVIFIHSLLHVYAG